MFINIYTGWANQKFFKMLRIITLNMKTSKDH